MKTYKLIIFICLLFNTLLLHAANGSLKVLLHVNDEYKISQMGNSVTNIRKELGDDVEIKVIVNGKAVTRLLKSNKTSASIIEDVLRKNVVIGVCHNALTNNRIDETILIKGMDVLKTDGNVAVISYQQQGYIYIKM